MINKKKVFQWFHIPTFYAAINIIAKTGDEIVYIKT